MNPILINNGIFHTATGVKTGSLLIEDGMVKSVGNGVAAPEGSIIIDAGGLDVLPGFVDVHVHFREPGYSYKETIKSGSESAAAGGYTSVCTMPNLNPVPDNVENLRIQLEIIKNDAKIEVLPYASITKKRMGHELVNFAELAPLAVGFSDDGTGVQSEEVMKAAMDGISETGKVLAAHCEVESLLKGGYIHNGEYAHDHDHKGICSESEWREISRDVELSNSTGCPLHICHVSTKESVEIIRNAKSRGINVTAETGPHYLAFSDRDLKESGNWKMNPPIRSIEDKEALIKGVIDGTIDVIATDHAPHSHEEKSKGLEKSAMGVIGLETAFAAINTFLVNNGYISFEKLIDLMANTPRKIFGISGGINPGERADIVIVDRKYDWIVDPDKFKTKGRSTPFSGLKLTGKVMMTISQGEIVYDNLVNNQK